MKIQTFSLKKSIWTNRLQNAMLFRHHVGDSDDNTLLSQDGVIKWKHFPRYWPFVWGIRRLPVNSPHKGQGHWVLMFSLICAWINAWVNNREAGDLRRHRAHYDAIVMILCMRLNNDSHGYHYARRYCYRYVFISIRFKKHSYNDHFIFVFRMNTYRWMI